MGSDPKQVCAAPASQIRRDRRGETHRPAGRGVLETQVVGVQEVAGNPHLLPGVRRMLAVGRIADNRMAERGDMDANLVGPARFERGFDERA